MKQMGKIWIVMYLLLPGFASASLWISEIHYNPEGGDSGYEWIEVFNDGNQIDVAALKFREGGVNHSLKESRGGTLLGEGERAVVADNPLKFSAAHPEYTGILIDSAFSLSNSGELLELVDAEGNTHFKVNYDPATGGNGNGKGIGLVGEVWYEVEPSPGAANVRSTPEPTDSTGTDSSTTSRTPAPTLASASTQAVDLSPATYIEIKRPDYKEKVIKVDAGGDRVVMAGVAYWFRGTVYGLEGIEVEEPRVRWNWGDGQRGEGATTQHVYRYPGTYTLSMLGQVGNYYARDRGQITVIEPALFIELIEREGKHLLRVENTSLYHLELSTYRIEQSKGEYVFPEDSFVGPGQNILLDEDILGYSIMYTGSIRLIDGEGGLIDEIVPTHSLLALQVKRAEEQAAEQIELALSSPSVDTVPALKSAWSEQASSLVPRGTHSVVYQQVQIRPDSEDLAFATETTQPKQASLPSQQAQLHTVSRSFAWQYAVLALLLFGMVILYLWKYHKQHAQPTTEIDTVCKPNQIRIVD